MKLVLTLFFSSLTLIFGEVHQWTSTSGTSMKASFVGVANGMVHLKRSNGKIAKVPFNKLSTGSQQLARKLTGIVGPATPKSDPADQGGFAPGAEVGPDGSEEFHSSFISNYLKKNPYLREQKDDILEKPLPEISGSPYPKTFAMHKGRSFDAIMNTRGGVEIYLKEGPTLFLTPIVRFTQDQGVAVDRQPVTLMSDARPALNATSFKCDLTYHGDVEAEINVEIRGNEISYYCTAKDNQKGKNIAKSRIQYVAAISTMPNRGHESGSPEHMKAAKDTILLLKAKGEDFPLPLTTKDSFYSLASKISELEVSGPLMGPRKIVVDAPKESDGYMRGASISKTEWWKGFGFKFYKDEARARAALKIEIE